MKIAMMTNNYKPFIAGVPISIERLAKGLRKRGHEVYIFAPEYENVNREEDMENQVIRYHSIKGVVENGVVIPNIFDTKIRESFEKEQFDLIHVHHPMLLGNVATHLSKKHNIPLIFTYHTKYEEYLHYIDTFSGISLEAVTEEICRQGKKVIPWYMKKYLKRCDMVFAPSEDMYAYVKHLKADVNVCVVPTGLPDEAFMKNEERSEALRKELLCNRKYLLTTVSRLEKEKNQYFLIDMVKELKEHLGNCFRLAIVGDGNERQGLEAYCEQMGLTNTIVFVGSVENEEVKNYLNASDAFVFSSKSETQGIVILEAMAAGIPVIALNATGVRDIVKNGENGVLVSEEKENYKREFLLGIEQVLTKPKWREYLSKNAREASLFYHENSVAQKAEAHYMSLLRKERSGGHSEWGIG